MKATFLTLLLLTATTLAATLLGAPTSQPAARIVGQITDPRLPESSGLVVSTFDPDIFWTHNDSGNPAEIFAIDRSGKIRAVFKINAPNRDWEDIAADNAGNLYLADIGNNGARRRGVQVYRIREPDLKTPADRPLRTTGAWELLYPAEPFDAEAFFVWDNHGYLIGKTVDFLPARLYRFSLAPAERPLRLEQVGTLPIRVPVTGADISRDGTYLAVQTIAGPYLFRINGKLDDLSKAPAGNYFHPNLHMESVAILPEGLLATDEPGAVIFFPLDCFFPPQQTTPPDEKP